MNPNECFFFQPTDYTSSATVCKWCGREKYQHKSEQKQLIIDIMNDDAKDGLYNKQTAVEWLIDQLRQLAHNQSTHLGMGDIRVTQGMLDDFEEQAKEIEKHQQDLLNECEIQLEYLNQKFGETGTTNALLSKLKNK